MWERVLLFVIAVLLSSSIIKARYYTQRRLVSKYGSGQWSGRKVPSQMSQQDGGEAA